MAGHFDLAIALAGQAGDRGFGFYGVVATQVTVGGEQDFDPLVT